MTASDRQSHPAPSDLDREALNRDGFIVVPGLYRADDIDRIMAVLYKLYRKFAPEDDALDAVPRPWSDLRFDQKMLALRRAQPQVFGALYDSMQGSAIFQQFSSDNRALRIAAELLGDAPEHMAVSGSLFRMDPPQDGRNSLRWHQDRTYFPQNFDGLNGVVYWVAMRDVPMELGPLVVCAGSHREGIAALKITDKRDYVTTEQREIDPDHVSRYEQRSVPVDRGDVVVMNMNTFHRSGTNTSAQFRFSALWRYHRMMADDYVPFRVYLKYNSFLIEKVSDAHGATETARQLYQYG
jgi:hypothetical protein